MTTPAPAPSTSPCPTSLLEAQPLSSGIVLTAHARQRCRERAIACHEVERLVQQPFLSGRCRRRGRVWVVAPSLSPSGRRRFLAAVLEPTGGAMVVVTLFRVHALPQGCLGGPHAHLHARGRRRQRVLAGTRDRA